VSTRKRRLAEERSGDERSLYGSIYARYYSSDMRESSERAEWKRRMRKCYARDSEYSSKECKEHAPETTRDITALRCWQKKGAEFAHASKMVRGIIQTPACAASMKSGERSAYC